MKFGKKLRNFDLKSVWKYLKTSETLGKKENLAFFYEWENLAQTDNLKKKKQ